MSVAVAAPAIPAARTEPAVIQGTVTLQGSPLGGAYVRLLDLGGGVAAEVPTSASGTFRFLATPGTWRVLALAPGATIDREVDAVRGQVSDVVVTI